MASCGDSGPGNGDNAGTGGSAGGVTTGGSAGSVTTGGSAGAGGPDWPSCGEQKCGADEFCNFQYDYCSVTNPEGGLEVWRDCYKRDFLCNDHTPVCGCDGTVYPSQCAAYQAGVDIGGPTPTQAPYCDSTPAGRFPCGPWYCDPKVTFCEYREHDEGVRWPACAAWPAPCVGQESCGCLVGFDSCTAVPGNGVTGTLARRWEL